MSRAVVDANAIIRRLDRPATADTRTTAADVQNPETLARLVQELRQEVAELRRAWKPRRIDFEDIAITGTGMAPQTIRLEHGLGARVRFWAIGWESAGIALELIERADQTTDNQLALYAYSTGTVTIRVEEAG